jgi:hypothetical protein
VIATKQTAKRRLQQTKSKLVPASNSNQPEKIRRMSTVLEIEIEELEKKIAPGRKLGNHNETLVVDRNQD